MLSYAFGDDTTDGSTLTADQQAQVQQISPLGQQLEQAETDCWAAYNNIVNMATAASDPSFATIPVDVINYYNASQQQLVTTAMVYIAAQSQADGVDYTPNPPPLLMVNASSGLGGFGATALPASVSPRSVSVVYGPKGSQTSVPLSGSEARTIGWMHAARPGGHVQQVIKSDRRARAHAGLGDLGLGVLLFILLAVAITAAIIITGFITNSINQAHVANVQLAGQMTNQMKTVTTSTVSAQQQCISAGGNPIACTQAAAAAIGKTLQDIPKPGAPSSGGLDFWSTVGIVTIAAVGGVIAWGAYKAYKRRDVGRFSQRPTRAYDYADEGI